MIRRIKIAYDGTSWCPKITDVETGAVLPANALDWHWDIDNVPTAVVRLVMTEIDVETGAKFVKVCSKCEREFEEEAKEGDAGTASAASPALDDRPNDDPDSAFQRGRAAAIGNRPATACPYSTGGPDFPRYCLWHLGWLDVMANKVPPEPADDRPISTIGAQPSPAPPKAVEIARPGFLGAIWGRLTGWMRGKV